MSSNNLSHTPAWRLADLMRSKKLSPVELTSYFLERIDKQNASLSAYITVADGQAMEAARNAEADLMAGRASGPLHGVPVAIKDLNPTQGLRTTRGSLIFQDFVPDADDIAVERIRAAGAIILGKTNTPEFGWKATTENLLTEPCRNPWDTTRTSGGSSGGSASALAAGLAPLAHGSDAGGSIRIPASFCGVYGLKPTFGRVPGSYEGPGGWRNLSQNGPLATNVRDAALLLHVLSGPDPRDPMAISEPPPDFTAGLEGASVRGLRIAWSPDLDERPVDPEVRRLTCQAAQAFQELGATVEEASPVIESQRLIHVFMTLLLTDMAIGLGPMVEDHGHLLTPGLREWVEAAMAWPATRYAPVLRELEWHRWHMETFFQQYDLLLTPTMAVPAFPIEQPPDSIDDQAVDPRWGFTPFAYIANLSGHPAASIPCGFTGEGLPVGLQVTGRKGADATVLRASAAYEAAHPWNGRSSMDLVTEEPGPAH